MHRFAAAAVAAVVAAFAPPAAAIEWLCNLSHDQVQLVCIAEPDMVDLEVPGPVQRFVVRGVHYPLDQRLEQRIQLWTPPTDPEFVTELANATLCVRQPDCAALLVPSAWQMMPAGHRKAGWKVGALR